MPEQSGVYRVAVGSEDILIRRTRPEMAASDEWNAGRHTNADFELHIITDGIAELEIENRDHRLERGMAALISPGVYHAVQSDNTLPFSRVSVIFDVAGTPLKKMINGNSEAGMVFAVSHTVLQLCDMLVQECRTRREKDAVEALQTLVCIHVLRDLDPEARTDKAETAERTSFRTDAIDDYFEMHCNGDADEGELAKLLHISQRQLTRILAEAYGKSFREKKLSARMDRAAWLLRHTDLRPGRIASVTGYESEPSFYKAFRSYFGTSPRQYRLHEAADGTSIAKTELLSLNDIQTSKRMSADEANEKYQ